MKNTYDQGANAVYINLKETIEPGEAIDTQAVGDFIVDLNKDHEVLGIEVLAARSIFNEEFLRNCTQL